MTGKKNKQDKNIKKVDTDTTDNQANDNKNKDEAVPSNNEMDTPMDNDTKIDENTMSEKQDSKVAEKATEDKVSVDVKTQDSDKTALKENKAIAEKSSAETTSRSKSGLSILVLLILLLLIIGAAVGGYFGWQFWTQYSGQQEQRLQTLETYAAEQNTKVRDLSQQQTSQTDAQLTLLNDVKKNQQALQQRLDSHTQRLRALAGTSRDDWLLAEARYLLRLASQRLLVERGTTGALALLESADKILLSVDDSGVLPIRNAIAQEIIALKLAKSVDREGLYLQLSAIKNQIQQLPLIPFKPEVGSKITADETKTTTETEAPWYQSIWSSIKNGINSLGRFVEVNNNYYDQAPELLISTETKLQIVNNLSLMFEQAQFALLHEEEVIYKTSLEQAKKWWKSYYSHYNEYEVIHSELSKLQEKNIIQVLPNINRSSELLTDYIEQFHRLNNPQTITRPPAPETNSVNNSSEQQQPAEQAQPNTAVEPIDALPKTQEPQS